MRPKRLDSRSDCGVETTLSVIGGLWKPLILYHLMSGKKRFMELSRLTPQHLPMDLALAPRRGAAKAKPKKAREPAKA